MAANGYLWAKVNPGDFPCLVRELGRSIPISVAIMEPLHAPWRIAYIRGPKPAPANAAIFKQIAESSDDEANYVVVRERTCFAVLNRYPYTGGHLLIVPYKQSPDLNGLTEENFPICSN
jgi:hypothetical protein